MGTKTDSSHKPIGGRVGPANRSSTHWKDSVICNTYLQEITQAGDTASVYTFTDDGLTIISLLLFLHDYPCFVQGMASYLDPDQVVGISSLDYLMNTMTQDLELGSGLGGADIATWDQSSVGYKEACSGETTTNGVQVDGFLFACYFPYTLITRDAGDPDVTVRVSAFCQTPVLEGDDRAQNITLEDGATAVPAFRECIFLQESAYTQAMYDNDNIYTSVTGGGQAATQKIVGLWSIKNFVIP